MKYLIILMSIVLLSVSLNAKTITQITDKNNPQYKISVTHGGKDIGEIKIEMYPEIAPRHVHYFDSLVSIHFYDRTAFHRVIPGFIIQGGDPNSRDKDRSTWGYGDPSQAKVPAEFSNLSHIRGILSAARTQDINSATSQFFICLGNPINLDNKYTIYGKVVGGMDVADYIVNVPRDSRDNPLDKVEMSITKIAPNSIEYSRTKFEEIILYPNPENEIIKFKSNIGDLFIRSYQITDTSGKSLLRKILANPTKIENLKLIISNFSEGVYVIRMIDRRRRFHILKFIVKQ